MDDITKPRSTPDTNTAPAVPDGMVPTEHVEQSTPFEGTPVSEAPAQETVTPFVAEPAPVSTEQASEPVDSPEAAQTAAPLALDAQKKKSAMPLILIIVFLVVIGLAAAAYYAFIKTDSASTPSAKTTPTSQSDLIDPSATSNSIDASMNKIDESKDYNAADINDTTLGL